MALCYNFTRVLSIIGFDGFMAYLARLAEKMIVFVLSAALRSTRDPLRSISRHATQKIEFSRVSFASAK